MSTYEALLKQADLAKAPFDARTFRSEYIYDSEALDDLGVTRDQVFSFLATGVYPEPFSDELADTLVGHGIAYDAIVQLAPLEIPVSEELLQRLHDMLLGSASGYRTTPLAGGIRPEDIPHVMEHLIDQMTSSAFLHPIEYAAMVHKRIYEIKPWADGNEKMARLILSFLLIRGGFPPILIGPDQKEAYRSAIETLHKEYNMDPFMELIASNILTMQKRTLV